MTLAAWGMVGTCWNPISPLSSSIVAADGVPEGTASSGSDTPDFAPRVRRLLARRCLACHGPDEARRQADLRLDDANSLQRLRGDHRAVHPGDPDRSELLQRVLTKDPDLRMPPPDHGDPLSRAEIELLRAWIAAGAEVVPHWSWQPPKRHPAPAVRDGNWSRTAIDPWVLSRLESEGLVPHPEATRAHLLRRVALDLTGLPPGDDLRRWFLESEPPPLYEQLVDRLLASPQFGERVAQFWMDAARYADTNGYFTDGERSMWRWRDGVIAAFNANQPFDQFTLEQLAGDLLPNATEEHRLASGFNRNHTTNNETGLIDEEYRLSYAMDRLETTGVVWLGLTLNCARCHSHKFDPLSQREYYQLLDLFNQVADQGLGQEGNSPPVIPSPTPDQTNRLAELQNRLSAARGHWQDIESQIPTRLAAWEAERAPQATEAPSGEGLLSHFDFTQPIPLESTISPTPEAPRETEGSFNSEEKPLRPSAMRGAALVTHGAEPRAPQPALLGAGLSCDPSHPIVAGNPAAFDFERTDSFTIGFWVKPVSGTAACLLSKTDDHDFLRGFDLLYEKGRLVVHLNHRAEADAIRVTSNRPLIADWQQVVVTYDGSSRAAGVKIFINGEADQFTVDFDNLRNSIRTAQPLRLGQRSDSLRFTGLLDEMRIYHRVLSAEEVSGWFRHEVVQWGLQTPVAQRSPRQKEWFLNAFLDDAPREWRQAYHDFRQLDDEVRAFQKSLPTTMVMQQRPESRKTFVLTRGQYDQPQEEVTPALPMSLAGPSQLDQPPIAVTNRLEFARWLVSRRNPLTARVIVNRVWSQLWGMGLVKTVGDFGLQGEAPSHPELLDELALDFQDSGWDLKQLYRQLVCSATYRQSSFATPQEIASDPENRLLSRGARFRLEAEAIRDSSLVASGLLTQRLGGPSVKPWQPPGLWEAVSYDGDHSHIPSPGADRYRRGLYTFWKRQSPPPTFLIWDGPTRETCVVSRSRTNTPLQALAQTNDRNLVEAANVWACRLMQETPLENIPGQTARPWLQQAFRQLLVRTPEADELNVLEDLFDTQSELLRNDTAQIDRILQAGDLGPRDLDPSQKLDRPQWAALATVLQVLLTLDETLTRE
jgi:mono/diheme cytochrome c family protein